MSAKSIHSLLKRLAARDLVHLDDTTSGHELATHIAALLNSGEGTIALAGDASGERLRKLTSEARALISPRSLWTSGVEEIHSEAALVFDVPEGRDKPYTAAGKIYVRRGRQTVEAKSHEASHLLRSGFPDGERWERRLVPSLSKSDLQTQRIRTIVASALAVRSYPFPDPSSVDSVLRALSLERQGRYTNAAEVLFGKNPCFRLPQVRVRITRFTSTKVADQFEDQRTLEGDAIYLVDEALAYIRSYTPIRSLFVRGRAGREDMPVYPPDAIREAIVNAVVHRDYASIDGGISIQLFPNRLVIWNSGALPEGITVGALKRKHQSILRNPDIAHVFWLAVYMERVGRGIELILSECKKARVPDPRWHADASGVSVTFFSASQVNLQELNTRQQKVITQLREGDLCTAKEYMRAHEISERQAQEDLRGLVEVGALIKEGKARATVFRRTALSFAKLLDLVSLPDNKVS